MSVIFTLWYAPAVPPELGGAQRKFGRHAKKKFPALCAGVCALNFKTVSAPMTDSGCHPRCRHFVATTGTDACR